jgi:hypothetical protein
MASRSRRCPPGQKKKNGTCYPLQFMNECYPSHLAKSKTKCVRRCPNGSRRNPYGFCTSSSRPIKTRPVKTRAPKSRSRFNGKLKSKSKRQRRPMSGAGAARRPKTRRVLDDDDDDDEGTSPSSSRTNDIRRGEDEDDGDFEQRMVAAA